MFENIVTVFVATLVPFFGFTWFYFEAMKYKKAFNKADAENFHLRMENQWIKGEMALLREYVQDKKEAVQ